MGMHAISGVSTILEKTENTKSSNNFYNFLRGNNNESFINTPKNIKIQ